MIQKECDELTKKTTYYPGQIATTSAGKLNCQRIIHAIGPKWTGGSVGEESLLYDCIFKVLDEASALGHSTIAIPPISTGIYDFTMQLASQTIVSAVKDFLKERQPSSLKEIHFIDKDDTVIDLDDAVRDAYDNLQSERGNLTIYCSHHLHLMNRTSSAMQICLYFVQITCLN